jgi:hypothetical protein
MNPQLFRTEPLLPASAMTTYRIVSPHDKDRVAACHEVGCDAWRNGWDSILDLANPAHAKAAAYIRSGASGRTYREIGTGSGEGIVVFRFASGQRCFEEHHTRPEVFLRRGGDHRGNPRQELCRHANAGEWVEDFAEHQQRLAEAVERG